MTGKSITIAQVRASQNHSGAHIPFLFRNVTIPLAWPITLIFAKLGLTPNQATFSRAILTLASLALICATGHVWFLVGLGIYLFSLVLDHVDGNLCRVFDSASHFGKLFDGLTDSIAESLLPMAIGVHLWRTGADPHLLAAGGAAALALTLSQLILLRQALTRCQVMIARQSEPSQAAKAHPTASRVLGMPAVAGLALLADRSGLNLLWDLRYAGLIAAMITGFYGYYLWALALAQIVLLVILVPTVLLRGYIEFDVHRYSKSSA